MKWTNTPGREQDGCDVSKVTQTRLVGDVIVMQFRRTSIACRLRSQVSRKAFERRRLQCLLRTHGQVNRRVNSWTWLVIWTIMFDEAGEHSGRATTGQHLIQW